MSVKVSHPRTIQALAVMLVMLASSMITPTAYSQASGWSQPVRLSHDASAWFPDVAADATGRVHVVWNSAGAGYDMVMYTSSQGGQEWSEPTDIMALTQPVLGQSEATRPTVLVDQQGMFHLTFRDTTVYYTQAPAVSANSANAWLRPRPMNVSSQIAYFSRLARDGKGKLHLVFTENVMSPDCPICYHVFYSRSDDNGLNWSAPLDIADLPTGAAKPQILIDGRDVIHVVWEAGVGGSYGQLRDPTRVLYAASHDEGNTWATPVEVGGQNGQAKNIAIGLDGDNKLIVVWWSLPEDLVYYQVSQDSGRTWSLPKPIEGVWGTWSVYESRLDDYAMATDSAGKVHLALVGRTAQEQRALSVLHLTWDGSTWSEPEAITTLTGDAPEWPRIAIGNGNQLHAVWFVRDQPHIFESDKGAYQIWYARGSSSAPAIAPIVWPTFTPTPVSRDRVTFNATPSPVPRLDPSLVQGAAPRVSIESVTTETGALILLAKSLVPAVLLVAVTFIGIRIRRR